MVTAVTMAPRGVKSTWMIPWMCQETAVITFPALTIALKNFFAGDVEFWNTMYSIFVYGL